MTNQKLVFRSGLLSLVLLAAGFVSHASAGDTVWACKPGQSDLCAGTISGSVMPAPGQSGGTLDISRAESPPVDCFYVYPTVSGQHTPNANLDIDGDIKRVVVQQARMFSSVCNVYAPVYRQVTSSALTHEYSEAFEFAYQDVLAAWKDYLANYNHGRGVILLGHSQGSLHLGRLVAEQIDPDPAMREQLVGAMLIGGNISVPIGGTVGGLFQHVPTCTVPGEFGCLVAFSTYSASPGADSDFGRVNSGYWAFPVPRPDPARFEVACTDPTRLDGRNGNLDPLINFDYLTGAPSGPEQAAPWQSEPDFYKVECRREDGAHWLNISSTGLDGDTRPDFGALIADGTNYHVPEVNLAEGNLLRIARLQSESYLDRLDRIHSLGEQLEGLGATLAGLQASLAKDRKRLAAKSAAARKADRRVRRAKGKRRKMLRRKAKAAHRKVGAERRKIRMLRGRISEVKAQIAATQAELDSLSAK